VRERSVTGGRARRPGVARREPRGGAPALEMRLRPRATTRPSPSRRRSDRTSSAS
jgi:hypothetical protein